MSFVTGQLLNNRWVIGEVIGRGGQGCVYQAQDVWTGKDVAVKTQRIVHPGEFLLIESVHKATSGSPHFPQLEYIALIQDHVVTVTELLGSDMYEVLAHGGPVTDEMVGRIAIQMIDALEHLHSRGLLHMDLKPENIMGTLDDPMQFKLIDFGSSTPFITENGKHVPLSDGVRIPYTDLYQSLHAALRLHPSRRDDMESLAYVLFSMSYGRLPWEQDSPQIMFSKKYAAPWDPTLRREIPPAVMQYLIMVRQLRFEERPDYEGYRWMFRSMLPFALRNMPRQQRRAISFVSRVGPAGLVRTDATSHPCTSLFPVPPSISPAVTPDTGLYVSAPASSVVTDDTPRTASSHLPSPPDSSVDRSSLPVVIEVSPLSQHPHVESVAQPPPTPAPTGRGTSSFLASRALRWIRRCSRWLL